MRESWRPSLYRVAVTSMTLALAGNALLWRVSRDVDVFARVIAAASAVVALALLLSALVPQLVRLREESMFAAFAVWIANAVEWAQEHNVSVETRVRSCAFYVAFAIGCLGTYIAQRLARENGRHE